MDFFKSVFSSDPDPSNPPRDNKDADDDDAEEEDRVDPIDTADTPDPLHDSGDATATGGAWSFGGLIKTIASKSETVIQTYRRDLEEFGSGLKQETAAIRVAAARAVLDLPVSLETGASVAQESLESVGQAIDEFGTTVWRGTTEIISQGKEALNSIESDAASGGGGYSSDGQQNAASSSKRYSRFETQVLAIQSDPTTFSEEPEDADDFQKWKSGFDLAEKEEEIDNICYENGNLEDLFGKFVPGVVNYDTFWSRYYYKVHKLKLAEDARADLVKRAILRDEEELTWEVDDDEEEEGDKEESKPEQEKEKSKEEEQEGGEDIVGTLEAVEVPEENKPSEVPQVEKHLEVTEGIQTLETAEENKPSEACQAEKRPEVKEGMVDQEKPLMAGNTDGNEPKGSDLTSMTEDKAVQEAEVETGESVKDNNSKEVPSQVSMPEEDDLEWDEIEDLGEHDVKKVSATDGSPSKVDLRKRLSALEEGEDLSWDIEDDEPAKP